MEQSCIGWWAQAGLGRQEMEGLRIAITGTRLTGSGLDCVGPFTLEGTVDAGDVRLVKQYFDRHRVRYTGTFDGQTRLAGTWAIAGLKGPWEILLRDGLGDEGAVEEKEPAAAVIGD